MNKPLRCVEVDLGDRSYPVLVGEGARHKLASVVPPRARRAAIVTQTAVASHWQVDPGIEHVVFTIGEGEAAKSLSTIEDLCRGFARWEIGRAHV